MSIQNNNFNFTGYFVGEVLDFDRQSRRVSVYMPKLMPGIGGDSQFSSQTQTSSNPNVSGLNYGQTVRVRNSMWVEPYDFEEPLPALGSKVLVFFIDGNPKSGYWDRFNPNNDYQVIDEEKYPNLFTLRFSGSTVPLRKDDVLAIDFPEDFSSVLTQDGKSKRVQVFKRENYVISSERPEEPFPGMLWFNTSDEGVYAFSAGKFSRLLTSDDVADLYGEVDRISSFLEETLEFWTTGRLMFLPSFSSIASTIKSPVKNQIVIIDPAIEDDAFYKYSSLESEAALTEDGYYFLEYANLVIERSLGIERQLRAYKYDGSEWEEMDGWFDFDQPAGSLGDFQLSTNQTVNTTDTYEWDFRTSLSNADLDLKVSSLKFEGVSISNNTEVTFQFYSQKALQANTTSGSATLSGISSTSDVREGDSVSGSGIPSGSTVVAIDSATTVSISSAATATATAVNVSFRRNIGSEFTLVNTSGTLSLVPSAYDPIYLDDSDLFVPDISKFGVEVSNIRCDVESDVSTTLNFGSSIVLDARSSEEVA
jgi:hypothetical protein